MKLREEIHRSIDNLDDRSLQLAFCYVQELLVASTPAAPPATVPSLEAVVRLTSASQTTWADDVIASREERS